MLQWIPNHRMGGGWSDEPSTIRVDGPSCFRLDVSGTGGSESITLRLGK